VEAITPKRLAHDLLDAEVVARAVHPDLSLVGIEDGSSRFAPSPLA
jgi:hypothetical protein